jgi:hypothetical protein
MNIDLDSQDFFIKWCQNHNIFPNETSILEKDIIIDLLYKLDHYLSNNQNQIKIIEKNNKSFIQIKSPQLLDFFYKKELDDNFIFVKSDKYIIKCLIIIHLYEPNSKSYKVKYKKRKNKNITVSNKIVKNEIFIDDSD